MNKIIVNGKSPEGGESSNNGQRPLNCGTGIQKALQGREHGIMINPINTVHPIQHYILRKANSSSLDVNAIQLSLR